MRTLDEGQHKLKIVTMYQKKIPLPFGAGLHVVLRKTLAATIIVWRFFSNLNIVWMRFT